MPGPLRIGAGRLRRHSGGAGHLQKWQRAAEAAAAASAAAASEAAKAAEEEAARAASEAAEAARQEEERLAAEAAAAKRAEQVTAAQTEHDSVQYGDKLGRIWVEGTNVDCALYWGDSEGQFGRGAGCRAEVTASCPARTAQSLSAGIRARTSRTLARRSSVPSFIWRPTGATLPIKSPTCRSFRRPTSIRCAGVPRSPAASCTPATPSAS